MRRVVELTDSTAKWLPRTMEVPYPPDEPRMRASLPAKHAAIVAAPGSMIHAHDGACVAEVALTDAWRRRLTGVFAFPRRDA